LVQNDLVCYFFFSSRRRHTRFSRDWSSDVCSSDLIDAREVDLPVPVAPTKIIRPRFVIANSLTISGKPRSSIFGILVSIRRNTRSEERRVGKECGSRWATVHEQQTRKRIVDQETGV